MDLFSKTKLPYPKLFASLTTWELVSIPTTFPIPDFDKLYAKMPGPQATSRALSFSHFVWLLFFAISFFINYTFLFARFL